MWGYQQTDQLGENLGEFGDFWDFSKFRKRKILKGFQKNFKKEKSSWNSSSYLDIISQSQNQ
jgi:hypothetical protein